MVAFVFFCSSAAFLIPSFAAGKSTNTENGGGLSFDVLTVELFPAQIIALDFLVILLDKNQKIITFIRVIE
jgi:hypothetical protein